MPSLKDMLWIEETKIFQQTVCKQKLTYEYCRASRASPKAHFGMTTKPDYSREGIKFRLPRN